ncbi:MAG: PAC2 family protein [Tepidisphaeraceae bacterium]
MPDSPLTLVNVPHIPDATMVVALTGWMDGGLVSTGTVRHLMDRRKLTEVARIEPGGFYIDNFPGSMDIAAVFRPEVKYEGGLIKHFEFEKNTFHADEAAKLLFFVGREPNIDWPGYADLIFEVAQRVGVKRIVFMGSFGGTVPHTREPRLYGSVSSKELLPLLPKFGLRATDYEGPGSFAAYLLYLAPQRGMEMLSIAVEIPGYLQGPNPLSIEAVTRRLGGILDVEVDLAPLRKTSTEWELEVTEAIEKDEELAERVKKLEEEYDDELVEEQQQG